MGFLLTLGRKRDVPSQQPKVPKIREKIVEMKFRVLLLIALIQIACSNSMPNEKVDAPAEKGADIRQADEVSEPENPSEELEGEDGGEGEDEVEGEDEGEDKENLTLNRVDDSFDTIEIRLITFIRKRIAEAVKKLEDKITIIRKDQAFVSSRVSGVTSRVSSLEKTKLHCQSSEFDKTLVGGNSGKGVRGEHNVDIRFPRAFMFTPSVAYSIVKGFTAGHKPIGFDADIRASTKTYFRIGLQNYATGLGYFKIRWMACGIY